MEDNKSPQTVANQKWESKNREYASYLKSRSSARSFIRNKSTVEDIKELRELLDLREEILKLKKFSELMPQELSGKVFSKEELVSEVEKLLKKYNIKFTEVWQNPAMLFSIRVYDGLENRIMNIFFKEEEVGLLKKVKYIFDEVSLDEDMTK